MLQLFLMFGGHIGYHFEIVVIKLGQVIVLLSQQSFRDGLKCFVNLQEYFFKFSDFTTSFTFGGHIGRHFEISVYIFRPFLSYYDSRAFNSNCYENYILYLRNNCKEVMWLKDMTFLMTAILMTSLQGNESLKNLGLGRFTLRNECSIWAPKGMLAAGSEIFSHIGCLSDPTNTINS